MAGGLMHSSGSVHSGSQAGGQPAALLIVMPQVSTTDEHEHRQHLPLQAPVSSLATAAVVASRTARHSMSALTQQHQLGGIVCMTSVCCAFCRLGTFRICAFTTAGVFRLASFNQSFTASSAECACPASSVWWWVAAGCVSYAF